MDRVRIIYWDGLNEKLDYIKIAKYTFVSGSLMYVSNIIAPSPVNLQLYLSYSILILSIFIVILSRYFDKLRDSEYVKYILIYALTFIILRYFWWRTFNTIDTENIINFTLSFLLYVAEVYSMIIAILGIFFSVKPIDRRPIEVEESQLPTVDIFIPTYNEPPEIPAITAMAALNMDYPQDKFNVYILDDGGTTQKLNDPDPEKQKFFRERAEELKDIINRLKALGYKNIHYLTRERNLHAKSGNINEALKKTNGDLILILDADHIPSKDFLIETVGFFVKYPKTFLVQTPHMFYNPDPIEKNTGIFGKTPGENEMFYFLIQKGFDLWNASFFCGSAALLRRKYLEEVGGIQAHSITEDAETALELHSRGYESIYYSKPMIYGLNPETLSGMIVQRVRWAQGMIQIFMLKNPLKLKGLKWYQKLAYLNANIFWFFGLARVVFLLAPLAYLFFGLHIYDASLKEALAYSIPDFLASLTIFYYLFSKVRWPFMSEIYETILGVFTAIPILKTIYKPREPTFIVTPKGELLEEDYVSPFYKPYFVIYHLVLIGFISGIYRWFAYPDERGVDLVTLWWNSFNFFIMNIALYVVYERKQKRAFHRIPANDKAIVYKDQHPLYGKILDISLGGMSIKLETKTDKVFEKDEILNILIWNTDNEVNYLKAKLVRYEKDRNIIRFKFEWHPEDVEIINKIIEIIYSPSTRWQYMLSSVDRELTPVESISRFWSIIIKEFMPIYKSIYHQFKQELKVFFNNLLLKLKQKAFLVFSRIKTI